MESIRTFFVYTCTAHVPVYILCLSDTITLVFVSRAEIYPILAWRKQTQRVA